MAFDCAFRGIRIDESTRLTRDAVAAAACEHGLGAVYVIASVEIVPRRWRRHTVDVVVHLADGDDILGLQFPDEAREAVEAAVDALLGASPALAQPAGSADTSVAIDAPAVTPMASRSRDTR